MQAEGTSSGLVRPFIVLGMFELMSISGTNKHLAKVVRLYDNR
jgi:hypothetical protein